MEPVQLSHLRAALVVSGLSALSSPEEVFGALSDRAPVGVFVAAATGEYEYVNERWCALAGMPASEALGDGWAAALHAEDAAAALTRWREGMESCRDGSCVYRFRRGFMGGCAASSGGWTGTASTGRSCCSTSTTSRP
jgi:PAS domain-containing protein